MEYVADTVAIVRHFSSGRVGKGASAILQDADKGKHTIWVSVVSLAEILYLSEKRRISVNLKQARKLIEDSDNFRIVDLSADIVEVAGGIKGLEIFDRLIVGTAKSLGFPLLTSDAEIMEKGGVEVVWN